MFTLQEIETRTNNYLVDHTLEELLEKFDITAVEAFMRLYNEGLIDEDILEELSCS